MVGVTGIKEAFSEGVHMKYEQNQKGGSLESPVKEENR